MTTATYFKFGLPSCRIGGLIRLKERSKLAVDFPDVQPEEDFEAPEDFFTLESKSTLFRNALF
jgi:hypothetical protein